MRFTRRGEGLGITLAGVSNRGLRLLGMGCGVDVQGCGCGVDVQGCGCRRSPTGVRARG